MFRGQNSCQLTYHAKRTSITSLDNSCGRKEENFMATRLICKQRAMLGSCLARYADKTERLFSILSATHNYNKYFSLETTVYTWQIRIPLQPNP